MLGGNDIIGFPGCEGGADETTKSEKQEKIVKHIKDRIRKAAQRILLLDPDLQPESDKEAEKKI